MKLHRRRQIAAPEAASTASALANQEERHAMKASITAVLLVAFAATPALAQPKAEDHSAHHPASAASAATDMTEGEVRKVDQSAAKITIRHGEIKRLDMPPMTMVFQIRPATLLNGVKAGDKVRFRAEQVGSAYVVTAIEPAP